MDPVYLSARALDRAHHLRSDAARLASDSRLAVVPLWRDLTLVAGHPPAAVLAEGEDARRLMASAVDPVFLGLDDGRPVFAADLSAMEAGVGEAGEGEPDLGLPVAEPRFLAIRGGWHLLSAWDAGLLAYARAMVLWHRRHRFCGLCGAATASAEGGHVRHCRGCGDHSYPRTDPAVIMLVEDGGRILLHRQKGWPVGMWSALAGFVEPGETLEQAVCREVHEETAVEVADIRYFASQPWPFPASLMVAFTARAVAGELTPATNEIEDARWFDRGDLAHFDDRFREAGGGLFLARPGTVARQLVEAWLTRSPG